MIQEIEGLIEGFENGRIGRRQLVAGLLTLAAGGGTGILRGEVKTQGTVPTFEAIGVQHVALDVTDLGRSSDFYRKHLGLRVTGEGASSVFLSCGDEFLALFRAARPAMNHYCFSVRGYDAAAAVARLRTAGIEPRRRGDRVYFDDPDGLEVQVAG